MKKFLLFTFLLATFLSQAQVSLVKDINSGSGNGIGNEIVSVNDRVVFAGDEGINGFGLWTSDGTEVSTNEYLISGSAKVLNPTNLYNYTSQNLVAFSAQVGAPDKELWFYDGLNSSYATSNFNTSGDSNPSNFGLLNGFIVFAANNGVNGTELVYSFPFGGVTLIQDINVGTNSSSPNGIIQLSNSLYFSANDGVNGRELWKATSTATNSATLLLDINNGTSGSNPESFTIFNGKLYFTADDGVNGRELWVTDGTVSGTQMVMDLYAGATGSNPQNLTVYNNLLCFTATHPTLGAELFKMTTLEAVFNVKNIASSANSSNPSNLHVFNGKLYFSADDGTNGIEFWSSTGFSSTTNMLKNINTNSANPDSNPKGFTEYNGKLYFSADDGTNGIELWVTDGTNGGTVMVDDINSSGSSNPSNLIVANNLLFFAANNGSSGSELFKYYDPSLSTNDVELESSIILFPNPISNLFTIDTNQPITEVSIYDVQGKSVKSFKNQLTAYNIKELTSGLYFIRIKTDKGQITKKLIKQ